MDGKPSADNALRLRAMDEDDLQVIAACLQDALVPLREMAFMGEERRFMAAFNRFQWERLADPDDVADLHPLPVRPSHRPCGRRAVPRP